MHRPWQMPTTDKSRAPGVPWWPSDQRSGIVTAVAKVWSQAWELESLGMARKKKEQDSCCLGVTFVFLTLSRSWARPWKILWSRDAVRPQTASVTCRTSVRALRNARRAWTTTWTPRGTPSPGSSSFLMTSCSASWGTATPSASRSTWSRSAPEGSHRSACASSVTAVSFIESSTLFSSA